MRVILAAAAALAVITVSGCDINTGPAKTAKVECNCGGTGTPPAGMRGSTAYPPAPAEPYHHRWHHERHDTDYARWHGGSHSYYWRREYAELSVATYDYHSTSHSYYMSGGGGGSSGASAYAYAGAYGGGSAYAGAGAHGGGYSDHHGDGDRGHGGGDAYAGDPAHYETHGGGDSGRLRPWHGYDVDCPDDARH